MTGHLLVIDASGFAFRSFYSFPPYYRESDGQPTGAILGFMSMIWRMLGAANADRPTHAIAVFDTPGKTFRHELFPAYKANRAPARSFELSDQMPFMRHAAEALGLAVIEKAGFEADDVIASIVTLATMLGLRSTIVSSDKDFGQLVIDGTVEIVDPMAKRRVLAAEVEDRFGVPPWQAAAVQALWGDAVDGIPGIEGCGKDIAARLIRRFGTIDGVIANIADCRFKRVQAELRRKRKFPGIAEAKTGADWARLFLKLTTLRHDVPIDLSFDDMIAKPPVRSHVDRMLRVLEAGPRFQSLFAIEPQEIRTVAHVEDEFAWWNDELIAPGQRISEEPQSGFYKIKLVKGGPWVKARIWRTRLDTKTDLVKCEIAGKARDPFQHWPSLSMNPIAKHDYNFMTALALHAQKHEPHLPQANPTKPIDILSLPVSINQKRKP